MRKALIDHHRIESAFFSVLEDLKEYSEDLTLVGGWLPYIYSNHLWKDIRSKPITTVGIDFGFGNTRRKRKQKTIFEKLSSLDYTERHVEIGKIYPVVLYKRGKIPVEFITYPEVARDSLERLVGRQIYVNKVIRFDFLLRNRIPVIVKDKRQKSGYKIYCPKPSAFLYHKGATFLDREDDRKQAKDLHYMYFIIRYAPEKELIFREAKEYKARGCFGNAAEGLAGYFDRVSSKGCLLVEKENGPDEFIYELKKDIFERFNEFIESLTTGG